MHFDASDGRPANRFGGPHAGHTTSQPNRCPKPDSACSRDAHASSDAGPEPTRHRCSNPISDQCTEPAPNIGADISSDSQATAHTNDVAAKHHPSGGVGAWPSVRCRHPEWRSLLCGSVWELRGHRLRHPPGGRGRVLPRHHLQLRPIVSRLPTALHDRRAGHVNPGAALHGASPQPHAHIDAHTSRRRGPDPDGEPLALRRR